MAGDEQCDDGADNGVGGKCKDDCSGLRVATVEGDAIPFDKSPAGRIAGAEVSILEFPEMMVVTGRTDILSSRGCRSGRISRW
jgi:hypothetical protein